MLLGHLGQPSHFRGTVEEEDPWLNNILWVLGLCEV